MIPIAEIHKTKLERMSISILTGELTLAFIATYIIIGEIIITVLMFCGIGALLGPSIYEKICSNDVNFTPKLCGEMSAEAMGILVLFMFTLTSLVSIAIYVLYHLAHIQWCSTDATVSAETVENPPDNIVITDNWSRVVNGNKSISYAMKSDVWNLQRAFMLSYFSSVVLLIFGCFVSAVLMYIFGPLVFNPIFILLENKLKSKSQ